MYFEFYTRCFCNTHFPHIAIIFYTAIKLILLCIEITAIASALIASHVENYMFGI